MVDFNFYLNRQGSRGLTGEKGDTGFSPIISVLSDTATEYILNIQNETTSFQTPNLRPPVAEGEGSYVRVNELGNWYIGEPSLATQEEVGMVQLSDVIDANDDRTAVTPNLVVDYVDSHIQDLDSNLVHKTGDETISGRKRFIATQGTEILNGLTTSGGITLGYGGNLIFKDSRNATVGTIESYSNNISINPIGSNKLLYNGREIATKTDINNSVNTLNQAISNETSVRYNADIQLQTNIDAERAEREAQDSALQSQLNSKLTVDNIKAGDNITLSKSGNSVTISSTGGGGSTYTQGDGISISNNVISTRIDNQTIKSVDGTLHADFSEIGDEVNALANRMNTAESGIESLDERVTDLEESGSGVAKFPNATIFGEPTIQAGQVSNLINGNYLQFPFALEHKGRAWECNLCFTTHLNDVSTQQNIIDSRCSIALAVRGGRLVLALSTTGTTFDIGEFIMGQLQISPHTTYYVKIIYQPTIGYTMKADTKEIDDSSPTYVIGYPNTPIASTLMTISSPTQPFYGSINLNNWDLYVEDLLVWQGMDDVGLSTRLDTNLSNVSEIGKQTIKDIAASVTPANMVTTNGDQTINATKTIYRIKSNNYEDRNGNTLFDLTTDALRILKEVNFDSMLLRPNKQYHFNIIDGQPVITKDEDLFEAPHLSNWLEGVDDSGMGMILEPMEAKSYLLHQENVLSGTGIEIDKTDKGIRISSTGGGSGTEYVAGNGIELKNGLVKYDMVNGSEVEYYNSAGTKLSYSEFFPSDYYDCPQSINYQKIVVPAIDGTESFEISWMLYVRNSNNRGITICNNLTLSNANGTWQLYDGQGYISLEGNVGYNYPTQCKLTYDKEANEMYFSYRASSGYSVTDWKANFGEWKTIKLRNAGLSYASSIQAQGGIKIDVSTSQHCNFYYDPELMYFGKPSDSAPKSINIKSGAIDGQWVSKEMLLSTSTTVGTYELNLSSYLPNDNYEYEIIFNAKSWREASSGVSYIFFYTSKLPIDGTIEEGDHLIEVNGDAKSSTSRFIYPIGLDRSATLKITSSNTTEFKLIALGYRRVGTNE